MSNSLEDVASRLTEFGLESSIKKLEGSVPTAQSAADFLGCDVGAIANSLVFMADDMPVLILTSGSHRVDVNYVATKLGISKLKSASREQVSQITGQEAGGVAPVGHAQPLKTYLDKALQNYSVIWASAGAHDVVFSTDYSTLQKITNAEVISVAA